VVDVGYQEAPEVPHQFAVFPQRDDKQRLAGGVTVVNLKLNPKWDLVPVHFHFLPVLVEERYDFVLYVFPLFCLRR
jgi:hypothetical protein